MDAPSKVRKRPGWMIGIAPLPRWALLLVLLAWALALFVVALHVEGCGPIGPACPPGTHAVYDCRSGDGVLSPCPWTCVPDVAGTGGGP